MTKGTFNVTVKTILKRAPHTDAAVSRNKAGVAVIAECGIRFVSALILTMANAAGGYSPFAVGFVAAAPPGAASISALTGAMLGYFLFGTFETSLKYSAMCVLVSAAVFAFRETRIFSLPWFRPVAAGAMAACTGFVYAYDAGWTLRALAAFTCETAVIAAYARFYSVALAPWRNGYDRTAEISRNASMLMALASLTAALTYAAVPGVMSLGRVLAVLCVLTLAFSGGTAGGAVCGVIIGAATDIVSGTLFFTVSYTLSALVAAIFRRRSRLIFTLVYIAVATLTALCLWENLRSGLVFYEIFTATVIFMLLPDSVMTRLGSFFPSPISGYGAILARECARKRTLDTSAAFRELSCIIHTGSEDRINDENSATVFDRAADRVCRKCVCSADCWQTGYESTLGVFNDLTPHLRETGAVDVSDFPEFFAEKCHHLPQLTAAITEELRSQLYRRQYRSRVSESRGAAAGQYSDMADILDSIAEDLGGNTAFEPDIEQMLVKYLRSLDIEASAAVMRGRGGRLRAELTGNSLRTLKRDKKYLDKLSAIAGVRLCAAEDGINDGRLTIFEAEPLSVTIGTAAMKRKGQNKSGDLATFFKTDEGRLYILLSDGMGTGADAAKYSKSAVLILERLLRAGAPIQTALHLLNNLMLLKNGDETGTATVDLMCIDLFSGDAEIYKYGGAPSYVICDNRIKRITGKAMSAPLGTFSDTVPECCRVKLMPNSLAVVVSDGVTRGLEDTWLCEMLAGVQEQPSKDLAKMVLDNALKMFGADDDMTVLTARIEERK